jgi:hypothetical protein
MDPNQERMEAKLWSEIKTIQEKMDGNQEGLGDWQEQMKAWVGSLASRIDANQEEKRS